MTGLASVGSGTSGRSGACTGCGGEWGGNASFFGRVVLGNLILNGSSLHEVRLHGSAAGTGIWISSIKCGSSKEDAGNPFVFTKIEVGGSSGS